MFLIRLLLLSFTFTFPTLPLPLAVVAAAFMSFGSPERARDEGDAETASIWSSGMNPPRPASA